MNVHVETAEGRATICGDVIYDFNDQIVNPFHELHHNEPRTTGNHGITKREEKAAIKRLLSGSRFLLPMHDKPAQDRARPGGRATRHGGAGPGRAIAAVAQLVPGVSGRLRRPAMTTHVALRPVLCRSDRSLGAGAAGSAPASSSRKGRSGTRRRIICCSPTCRATCAAADGQRHSRGDAAGEQVQRHDL